MRLEFLESSDLQRLETLWCDVHAQHQTQAPELAPYLDATLSRAARRRLYDHLLGAGGSVLVANDAGVDVGYAAWRDERMPWSAAFDLPPRLTEIVSLCVLADKRKQGIGTALLSAANASSRGVPLASIVPGNSAAFEFFSRRGFVPTWLILSCFGRELLLPEQSMVVPLEPVTPDQVEALKPVWLSVHHQHQAVAPHLAPFVSDEVSWRNYRSTFCESARQGLLLRAGTAEKPLAMGCAAILDDISRFSDTWQTSGRVAEIEVLAVLPSARGKGFGTGMMRALSERLREIGIWDMIIGVVESNLQAVQLYKKWDFRPTCLQLTKRRSVTI
jgi:GNAT superfamily N-acetyltransferase